MVMKDYMALLICGTSHGEGLLAADASEDYPSRGRWAAQASRRLFGIDSDLISSVKKEKLKVWCKSTPLRGHLVKWLQRFPATVAHSRCVLLPELDPRSFPTT